MISFNSLSSFKVAQPSFSSRKPETPVTWFNKPFTGNGSTVDDVIMFQVPAPKSSQEDRIIKLIKAIQAKPEWKNKELIYRSPENLIKQLKNMFNNNKNNPLHVQSFYIKDGTTYQEPTILTQVPKLKNGDFCLPMPFAFIYKQSPYVYVVGSLKDLPEALKKYFKSSQYQGPKSFEKTDYLKGPDFKNLSAQMTYLKKSLSRDLIKVLETTSPEKVIEQLKNAKCTFPSTWEGYLQLKLNLDTAKVMYEYHRFQKQDPFLYWAYLFSTIPELKTSLLDNALLQTTLLKTPESAKSQHG